tara:strand:+ start:14203 stop:16104 length:1902 start_codon:yes stop_codon:yes gene_type:complete
MAKKKMVMDVDYNVTGADDVEKSFENIADSADEASESVEKVSESTGGLKGAFESAQGGVKGLIGGFKAVIANPIGAVIAAVVVAVQLLSDMFANNEEASDKMGQGFAYLKGLLLPLQKAFFVAFDAIMFAIEKPGEAWDNVVAGIEAGFDFLKTVVFDPYMAVWSILILGIEKGILKVRIAWNEWTGDADEAAKLTLRLDEVNAKLIENAETIEKAMTTVIDTAVAIGGAISDVIEEADRMGDALASLTRREQELTRAKRAQEVQNSKSLAQLEELRLVRDDEAKSLEERVAANKEIAVIEANRITQAVNLAQKELQLLKDRAKLQGEGTEILDLITEKEMELSDFRAESSGIRAEQIQNDVALRKEQYEKDAALVDQQLELDSVLEQNAVKLADAKIAAEQRKLDKLKELNLEENQIFRDQEHALALSKLESDKAKLDAQKVIDDELIAQNELLNDKKISDAKIASKKELEIKAALNDGILNFASSLTSALGEESKTAQAISKVVALTQIGIDTAKAISSLVAASSANPANAVTFGGAGAIQFATGLLSIGSNIAQAYSILKQPAPQLSAGDSGSAPPPQTEQTAPDLGFDGRSAGTEQLGANIPIRAYVTETDITTSQNTAIGIQQLSQIG